MMRAIKTLATVIAALVVAAFVTASAMIQSSRASVERDYHANGVDLALPTDAEAIEDGHRMYRAYGCVSCHLEDGGGRIVVPNGIGYIAAPDLTLIASAWPVSDLDRAIRFGVRPSGAPLLLMPCHDYWYFDDTTVARIIAYTRTLPPAGRSYGPSSLSMLGHFLHAIDMLPAVPAEKIDRSARRPPMGEPGSVELGRTLGRMCTGCHGEHLSGGAIPGTDPAQFGIPENITPDATGLATWSEADFVTALRTGVEPTGEVINTTFMPWSESFQYFTDAELHSLWLFLQEQPPLAFGNH